MNIKKTAFISIIAFLIVIAVYFIWRYVRYRTTIIVQEEERPETSTIGTITPVIIDSTNMPIIPTTIPLPTNTLGPIYSNIPSHCMENYATVAGTANFSESEFASRDGSTTPNQLKGNLQLLMQQLEVIRAAAGNKPVTVSSGYRSVAHNAAEGGAAKSKHVCCQAADIKIAGMSANKVYDLIAQLIESGQIINGGLGKYNTFTHYDISTSRRWDYS